MKTAIVYDYVPSLGGGAERALFELVSHFAPDVDVYFGFVVDSEYSRNFIKKLQDLYTPTRIHTGPIIKTLKQITFRLMNFQLPALLQSFNLQSYDLVVSFTAFLAHAIVPPEHGKHVLYMNTPARFLWNLAHAKSILKDISAPFLITDMMRFRSQLYDIDGINKTDQIIAISQAVQDRIETFYNKKSDLLYPASVEDSLLTTNYYDPAIIQELGQYFTHVSRIESYKNIDTLVKLVQEKPLVEKVIIMGEGPYRMALMNSIQNTETKTVHLNSLNIDVFIRGNVIFTGYIEETNKMKLLANASASFSLNDEDFGITKVESLAVGTPVIAWAAGAAPEIVTTGINGVLYAENTTESLNDAIITHRQNTYDKNVIKESAKPFTFSAFHTKLTALLDERIR